MGLSRLDHINIDTAVLEETVSFYVDALGLVSRPKPSGNPGVWLYLDDTAVIHVNVVDHTAASTGAFNHVAFVAEDFAEMRDRLDAAHFSFREAHRPDMGRSQIFVEDPNGIQVEMTFPITAPGA